MIDLKPYYDAARAADDEVLRIMASMNEHFNAGTDDGKAEALGLRPALDEAKNKADEANRLYMSMRDAAAQSNSVARTFVPVAGGDLPEAAGRAKTMKRQEFLALNTQERMAYIRDGGTIVDEEE